MWNIIFIILGFFLTRKDKKKGNGDDADSGGGGGGGISSSTWDKIVLGVFFAVLYVVLKKSSDASKREQALQDAPSNPYVQQAIAVRQACNSSGNDWMINYDGTDEDALFALAPQIGKSGWSGVQEAYQQLYAEPLTERLTKELGNADFQKFLLLLNAQSGGSSGGSSGGPLTPTVLNPDPYQVPGRPSITGKIVKVLRGKTVYHTNVNPKRVFAGGTSLGAAKGWKIYNGKLVVVYEYSPPGLFSTPEIHYADPYTVYLV
ncbi:hypothetical protein [Fibrella aquatilis]|uniref:Uncharacterized protein n=1 Tax=Fibrella aquatilis TaxID=2817059 RepID=A0A939K3Q8_9BACT|nr:hypothetical protein [Fibrella aquatilis]MBO0934600.1 hypothetical protein [Fibrella aquatilis]